MTADDIVAELDRWLDAGSGDTSMVYRVLQRARDEIVTWRIGPFALAMTERGKFIRNEALEEAAQVCDALADNVRGTYGPVTCATEIRALKEK